MQRKWNKEVSEAYSDVHIHIESAENHVFKVIKANKVILAMHSKYFDRIFTSSRTKSAPTNIFFVGNTANGMVDVLKLLYGENVSVSQRSQKAFESLLLMLEKNFSNATTDSVSSSFDDLCMLSSASSFEDIFIFLLSFALRPYTSLLFNAGISLSG